MLNVQEKTGESEDISACSFKETNKDKNKNNSNTRDRCGYKQ